MNNYINLINELKVILKYEINSYNNYNTSECYIVKHTLERVLEELSLLEDKYIGNDK